MRLGRSAMVTMKLFSRSFFAIAINRRARCPIKREEARHRLTNGIGEWKQGAPLWFEGFLIGIEAIFKHESLRV